ncbi:helicase HerA-like domain-containing protein [Desulfonatronum lacustre]|uniref:helicase HerA-like domain-containing protein n=1 Tax=Desulfonatronum lacustre TaxID=66849 RepID=UPI00048B0FC3|nr:helicase HerA-like domain-containing protein [Desulfonatronum lacustre]
MNTILIGKGREQVFLHGRYANRHGMIAGATGTGKSVSLMVLAEGFSRLGVPVFLADVKGDLAGLAMPGAMNDRIRSRLESIGIEGYANESNPVLFWDIFGELGHPLRTTVSQMGPTLLARLMELNDTQAGVLEIVFRLADEEGLLLLDLKDLRSLLIFTSENVKSVSARFGLVHASSLAAIQRALLRLDGDGGDLFFGEPALELTDFMRQDMSGRGIVNVLAAEKLYLRPRMYSSFLLWMLSELFETLPEVGDRDLPKMVFFFDEAHLLFADAPSALRQRVEQVVRLIRSKGVGVYFCSQYPDDVPQEILGQLGNRIQHALRAYTPRDQKAVRVAAQTFPPNPAVDVLQSLTAMAVGEALVTTLQDKGIPLPVERALVAPPRCRIGVITPEERQLVRGRSPLSGKYDTPVDRESAYEILQARAAEAVAAKSIESTASGGKSTRSEEAAGGGGATGGVSGAMRDFLFGSKRRQGALEAMGKSAMRTVGSQIGRQVLRGVLGGLLGGRK